MVASTAFRAGMAVALMLVAGSLIAADSEPRQVL